MLRHLIAKCLRGHTSLLRLLIDLHAMLVGTDIEHNLIPEKRLIPCDHVGLHHFERESDMW